MTNTTHTIQTITATGLAAIMALGLTACMDGIEYPENYPTNGSKTITATSNPQDISADQLGHTWPLTVDHGTVSCTHNSKGDPVMRFTAPDGTQYALNQTSDNKDLPDINQLLADGKSTGTLTSFAFTVCDVK